MEDSFDSPFDFLSPSLRSLDSSLRCPICKSLFTAPNFFSTCLHPFCSKCIREALDAQASMDKKMSCPTCWKDGDHGKLKFNLGLDGVVKAWEDARPTLLKLEAILNTPAPPPLPPNTKNASINKNKRALPPPLEEGDSDIEIIDPPTASSSSKSKSSSSKGKEKVVEKSTKKKKVKVEDDLQIEDGDQVICPICQSSIPRQSSFDHVGRCTGFTTSSKATSTSKPTSKAQWGQLFDTGGSASGSTSKVRTRSSVVKEGEEDGAMIEEKLSVISYKNENEKSMKLLLEAQQLSLSVPSHLVTKLEKLQHLKDRHKRWTTIWNSNCDLEKGDSRKLTRGGLRKELEVWERVMMKSLSGKKVMEENVGTGKNYAKENEQVFKDLIEKARPKPKPSTKPESINDQPPQPQPPETSSSIIIDSDEPLPPPIPSPPITTTVSKVTFAPTPSPAHSPTPSPSPPIQYSSQPQPERSPSPFDPEGPKPSQRVRDDFWGVRNLEDEDEDEDELEEEEDAGEGLEVLRGGGESEEEEEEVWKGLVGRG